MGILKKYELSFTQLFFLIFFSYLITSRFTSNIPRYVLVVLFITVLNIYMETLFNKKHTREQKAIWFTVATLPFNVCIVFLYIIYFA
ncbi:hypothetical protein ERICI_02218 [Paenibacillus larvae subsp. larvae]|uniref:Uncharacterized protein n=3 Tax=Paenibacillus larvae TaxID=1464 RepID=V9W5S0_9BACL|nr:hypothetical protein ERIC2_c16921 [Paenibacillus larvae subsp. larvae DSM 25430]AQR77004.1 hypothetical protein BXP28_06175 [Paenibacillus larvae subsp. larvae]ARF66588.1 hypothetical protein B7C51_00405 [Paenibacillus larvae subsp. pulvifaciens]ETK27098.1 hypothetical protein ERIC1_1c05390 [Paenibacillus larvae subsp. larvae DSM 25719]AVF22069.1 hypothetical protein ERICI_02218 [Paenibacillus larvae subsp. larvae]